MVPGVFRLQAARLQRPRRLAAVVLGASFAAALVGSAEVGAKPEKELFVLKTWNRKDCSVTPWTVADRLGFLKDEGLRFQFTGETQTPLQLPSVLSGDNDVGTHHVNVLAVAKAAGAPVTCVLQCTVDPADGKTPEPFRHLWFHVNPKRHPDVRSFGELSKLPGKIKVASPTRNTCQDFALNRLADKYGLSHDKFEWVTLPELQAVQALKQGFVDLTVVHAPFYQAVIDAGMRKIADTLETGLGPAAGLTYYYFRDDFLKKYPSQVAAFNRAMVRAQRYVNANPLQALKLAEEAAGAPLTGSHYYSETHRMDENLAKPWLADLESRKVIPAGAVTASSLVTHDFEKRNADPPERAAAKKR